MPDNLKRAARHATAAAASFALMGAAAKAAGKAGAADVVIVFMRNLVALCILAPWLLRKGSGALKTQRLRGHLWRSGFGLLGMYTLFYAVSHLPLAEALLLNYSSPLFIPFLAWFVLKEKPSAILIPAAILGLIGVVLIVKPVSLSHSFAALVGASSGVFAACAMVSLRRISNTEPPSRVVFYFALTGVVVSAIPLYWYGRMPGGEQMFYLVAVGLCATSGQLQLTSAYSVAPAARVGAMGYSAVIFAGLLGWTFWGERPDARSLLGTALVIATCVLASWQRAPKQPAAISPEDAGS